MPLGTLWFFKDLSQRYMVIYKWSREKTAKAKTYIPKLKHWVLRPKGREYNIKHCQEFLLNCESTWKIALRPLFNKIIYKAGFGILKNGFFFE